MLISSSIAIVKLVNVLILIKVRTIKLKDSSICIMPVAGEEKKSNMDLDIVEQLNNNACHKSKKLLS